MRATRRRRLRTGPFRRFARFRRARTPGSRVFFTASSRFPSSLASAGCCWRQASILAVQLSSADSTWQTETPRVLRIFSPRSRNTPLMEDPGTVSGLAFPFLSLADGVCRKTASTSSDSTGVADQKGARRRFPVPRKRRRPCPAFAKAPSARIARRREERRNLPTANRTSKRRAWRNPAPFFANRRSISRTPRDFMAPRRIFPFLKSSIRRNTKDRISSAGSFSPDLQPDGQVQLDIDRRDFQVVLGVGVGGARSGGRWPRRL